MSEDHNNIIPISQSQPGPGTIGPTTAQPDDIFTLNTKRAKRFQKIEGRPWGSEGAVIELMKQVGDLSALIMTKEGYYFKNREKYSEKYSLDTADIADELADIIYAVTRLANHYDIDVLAATKAAAKADEAWFNAKGIQF